MSAAPVQTAILAALRRGLPLTSPQIADRIGRPRPSVVCALRVLAKAGVVKAIGKEPGLRATWGPSTMWAATEAR